MIELVYEREQVGVWNKLPWNTSCGIGVRWEVLIRQAYWQWSTHRERTKRCDLVGLLSSSVVMTRVAILAACFPTLLSSGAMRDILCGWDNPKVVVGKPFRGGAANCHWWCHRWKLGRGWGKVLGQASSTWIWEQLLTQMSQAPASLRGFMKGGLTGRVWKNFN